ncbi:hypothetical protein CBOM_03861 [Ceraceosorus bombacis]|uniref:Uncharacterized protein n=1 Tax=Ceraceosorus bombacis TaxID=401625 RepID=A0A0N7LA45_9BASI|nr:hypothetical protein CBOM_03861 [Ceraceosorus bombacis]
MSDSQSEDEAPALRIKKEPISPEKERIQVVVPSSSAKGSPSKGNKNPWTVEEELTLQRTVYDLALKNIPEVHKASGLSSKPNWSVNKKLNALRARLG